MEVVILKMLNGEEVIARKEISQLGMGGSVTKYSKARVIQVMQGQEGKPQATLAPYITLSPDAEFTINSDTIVAEVTCPTEVEKSYMQATSSIALM